MTPDDDDKVKLYLLTPDGSWPGGYDTYTAAVVAATSSAAAQRLHPQGSPRGYSPLYGEDPRWPRPEHVEVKFIGYAADGIKIGDIISTSFRAG